MTVYMFRSKKGFVWRFLLLIVPKKKQSYSFKTKVNTIINCDFSQVAMLSGSMSNLLYCYLHAVSFSVNMFVTLSISTLQIGLCFQS